MTSLRLHVPAGNLPPPPPCHPTPQYSKPCPPPPPAPNILSLPTPMMYRELSIDSYIGLQSTVQLARLRLKLYFSSEFPTLFKV